MTRLPSPLRPRQRGFVTLAVSLVMLFVMSLMVFHTSSGMLLEIKTGNNQYYQAKALEAARGGVGAGLAWLATSNNYSNWTINKTLPQDIATQSIGNHEVSVTLTSISTGSTTILELQATANGDAKATVKQRVRIDTVTTSESTTTPNTVSLDLSKVAPVVINGGLSGVTGTPDITPAATGGTAIVTSLDKSFIDLGKNKNDHMTLNNDGTIVDKAFTGTAWDYVFPATSKQQMKEWAQSDSNDDIYYYNGEVDKDGKQPFLPPNPWPEDRNKKIIGSATSPAIVVFDTGAGCPKLNGGITIYGIVYYADNCGKNGWGGATIHGGLIAETSVTQLNANTQFFGWAVDGHNVIQVPTVPTISTVSTITTTLAKQTASWRDF